MLELDLTKKKCSCSTMSDQNNLDAVIHNEKLHIGRKNPKYGLPFIRTDKLLDKMWLICIVFITICMVFIC